MSDESLEAMKAQIEAMQKEMAKFQEFLAPLEEASTATKAEENAAYEEYQAKVAKIREKRASIDNQAAQLRTNVSNISWELKRKEQDLAKKIEEQELEAARAARQAEIALLNEKWDLATARATWREWAKDHQIKAGHYITENRQVILADPMGLGKTLSAIISADMVERATVGASKEFPFLAEEAEVWTPSQWIDPEDNTVYTAKYMAPIDRREHLVQKPGFYETKLVNGIERPVGKRILYFCPSSLIRNVLKEFRMWAGHRNVTFVGGMSKAERQFAFEIVLKNSPDFVVICNYEAWRKDKSLIQDFIDLDPDVVILDEAHNLKEMKTSAYKGIKTILDEAKPAYIIPMTGTPILNRPQELFSLLTLVNPKEFHHLNDFLMRYCEQNDAGFWVFQPGGLDRISKRIRKNFLRRTRDQAGIQLPAKTIINHDLELDEDTYAEQAKVRNQMRDYATIMLKSEKAITAAAKIAVLTRLRQVETWPAGIKQETKDIVDGQYKVVDTQYVEVYESQKLDYIMSSTPDAQGDYNGIIPEVINDERVVVFSQFKEPLRELKRRIETAGYRAVIMDGDTSVEEREVVSNDFDARYTADRANAKYDVVLCNYRVGGVGLNLTAATQMVILDEEWNPGKRDQAYDRIHRIGQENPVTIHVVRTQKTVDDWLANIMAVKENVVDGFNTEMVSSQEIIDALESGLM